MRESAANSSPFTKAKWIWTPGRTRTPSHFSWFRGSFACALRPRRATISCSADSKYRLWVNGCYVGFGPPRGHRDHPYFDEHDVSSLLRKGANVVAFLVEHYTRGSNIFSRVRGGLICQLQADGGMLAATGPSWRAKASNAHTWMPGLIFPEAFDARREPEGWEAPGFDDGSWDAAKVLAQSDLAPPSALRPRPIPLIREIRCDPVKLMDIGCCVDEECRDVAKEREVAKSLARSKIEPLPKGLARPAVAPQSEWRGKALTVLPPKGGRAVFLALDFGRNILASPEVFVRGPAGAVLDLGYSEMLEDNRVAPMRQNHPHCDRIVLRRGSTVHRVMQPRGFRFMMLRIANARGPVTILDLAAHEAIYPAKERGRFECSDEALGKIYRLSARTVNLCMEDGYTDCPWRERSQWLGDFQPEALFSYYAFGAFDIARKAVLEFADGNTPEGWLPGVFPVTRPFNLPTWGMRYPIIVWEYYRHSGDRETLAACWDAVSKQMAWLAKHEDQRGLLYGMPGWSFVDWTKTDSGCDPKDPVGALQGWYLEAVERTAAIARELERRSDARRFERRAGRLRAAVAAAYWSPKRGGFLKFSPLFAGNRKNAPPDLLGQHETFLFSLLKVGTPAMRRRALDSVRGAAGKYLPNLGNYQSFYCAWPGGEGQKGNVASESVLAIGTPFWSFYALLALMEAGEEAAAVEYMRVCWGLMLDHGATSCWEMWDRNTSLCHGWSAAPTMVLPAYVLGVTPRKPGFAEIEIRPRPAGLRWARGVVPTPKGDVRVEWEIGGEKGGTFRCAATVPPGAMAILVPPRGCRGSACRLGPGRHERVFPLRAE